MAAIVTTETVKLTINGTELEVPKGELIVESVKRLGLEIPIFCYHPRLKSVGMCRMCIVEVGFKQPDGSVRKMPKPQAGCTLPASDGMVIFTDTETVHRDRKGVLEFLLINHPLDCPICDRGGECPLQNNTLAYGPSTSRFIEMKRHLPKAYPLSEYVTLDLERCIQCGRCVRFTEEISGDSQLAFRFRGGSMQPSTFQLTDFESKFSGNVIEICPVGALTSAKYRFRARPWDLETKAAICTLTPCGTNLWFDYRAGRFVRINGRTNEAVNEEWTADKTKFGYDFYNRKDRILVPNLRDGDGFRPIKWAEAYSAILDKFENQGDHVGLILKANTSNENLYQLQKLFRDVFGSGNIDHRTDGNTTGPSTRFDPVGFPIQDLENAKSIFVLGTALADEQPMTFLRARKAWFQDGAKIVTATPQASDLDTFAHTILRYNPGTEALLVLGLMHLSGIEPTQKVDIKRVIAGTGVPESKLREAAAILGADSAFITSTELLKSSQGQAATELLAGWAFLAGAKMNQMVPQANSRGAELLGVLPIGGGKDTNAIFKAAAAGQLKALWISGFDPFEEYPDRDLVAKALETVDFLVVQGALPTQATAYASLVLPSSLPAEEDGTYTSVERRVQRMGAILNAPGDAKASWRMANEITMRARPGVPAFNPREIMQEIAAKIPSFSNVDYQSLPEQGLLIPGPAYEPHDPLALNGTIIELASSLG